MSALEPRAEEVDAVPVGVHTLGPQLHLGGTSRVLAPKVDPIVDRPTFGVKPRGGMWTSTWLGPTGSDWVQWCLGAEYGLTRTDRTSEHPWLLMPRRETRVYEIDSLWDLIWLCDHYPLPGGEDFGFGVLPSWEGVAADYDAVHLTEAGQWATRMERPSLYGWDCESTLWLRWSFADVIELGPRTWADGPDAWWDESGEHTG